MSIHGWYTKRDLFRHNKASGLSQSFFAPVDDASFDFIAFSVIKQSMESIGEGFSGFDVGVCSMVEPKGVLCIYHGVFEAHQGEQGVVEAIRVGLEELLQGLKVLDGFDAIRVALVCL